MKSANTSELKIGDVVLTHGMEVRIDSVKSCDGHPSEKASKFGPVFVCIGTILNMEEVKEAKFVPMSFIDVGPDGERNQWNVQGNRLALWTVKE